MCRVTSARDVQSLVGENIRLREIARRSKSLIKFIEERQVDVDLLITGTVEGTRFSACRAAGRLDGIAKQHEFCVRIARPKNPRPCLLRIIQHKGHELHLRLFGSISGPCPPVRARCHLGLSLRVA